MNDLTRRNFIGLAAVGGLGLTLGPLLSACSQDGNAGTGSAAGAGSNADLSQVIIVMGTGSEPSAGFDPFFGWGCGEHGHEPLIQSTLITTTKDMGFENDLATSYSNSNDGLTWTFKIRPDVQFSNNTPLTAKDVAYTLKGIRDNEGSETDLSMIKDVETPDDTTVVIQLLRPYNALLYTLALVGIVPAAAHGADYGERPIGSGRYLLEQWDRGQQVIFTANPGYYGTAPKMQRVIVLFMAEDAALAAARAGQADLAFTSAIFSNQTPADYEIFACKSVDSRGISLPTSAPGKTKESDGTSYPVGNSVTADIAIRRALNMAIDRDLMVSNVLNGYGSPAFSVSDGMPWASKDMVVATDIAAAKKLLADAGWTNGSDGIAVKDGARASLDLYYSASDSVRQALAAEFSNQAKLVGIEVKTHGASWDEIYPRQFSDLVLWGWGSNSPAELYSLYHSSSSGNFPCYYNKTVDKHLDDALATVKVEDSYPLWQAAAWDGKEGVAPKGAATWVWLANVDHLYFKKKNLLIAEQKLHPHGHGWSVVNDVDQWSWS
ncbi:MAG: ABC transporter substrate-binding protein [Actinomycetia bacterium]|nr:ABC transporter substrate-binding protein [Actinomycetes bacterium]